MSDLDRAWDSLAAGDPPSTALEGIDARMLLQRAEAAARSGDAAGRLAALKIAAAVGGRDGLAIARRLVRDDAPEVRRYAFNLGVAGGPDGLPVLREACAGTDVDLVVDALERLSEDKASTTRARGLLGADAPRVRAAAARVLGRIAGRIVVAELQRLRDDADPAVREAATEAIAQITGRGQTGSTAPREPTALPARREPQTAPEAEPALPATRRPAPPVPEGVLPAAPPMSAAARPGSGPAAPGSANDLLRQLGRDAVIARQALEDLGEPALSAAARGWRPGADPDLARGIARAAVQLGLASWAGTVRRLLADPSANVRIAALEALPALGAGPSVLGTVANLLRDLDPAVRTAAMRSVAALGKAQGRADLVRQRLAPLSADPDPEVKRVREELLADLA